MFSSLCFQISLMSSTNTPAFKRTEFKLNLKELQISKDQNETKQSKPLEILAF